MITSLEDISLKLDQDTILVTFGESVEPLDVLNREVDEDQFNSIFRYSYGEIQLDDHDIEEAKAICDCLASQTR